MNQIDEFRKKELNFNPFEKERGPYDETIDDFIEEIVKAFTIKKKDQINLEKNLGIQPKIKMDIG